MFQNGLCSFFLKNIHLTKKKKSICDRIVSEVTSMYYFIGIKGSGMAPLATILYELGNEVAEVILINIYLLKMNWEKEIFQFIHSIKII